ncbi:hypothetical protein [Actinopolyspora saharensis]|uniref:Uncharacterized protein n=1 Tax=Actinopolyspora saharensis TaxID=995062 RepID=A0A1H1G746_9ACTN|nr:hypothetical protein [Actinopolyspora saharensis]SDR09027.1 hypothetical protein SAMN04489718_3465 [Actinopolyspora saharensis]
MSSADSAEEEFIASVTAAWHSYVRRVHAEDNEQRDLVRADVRLSPRVADVVASFAEYDWRIKHGCN